MLEIKNLCVRAANKDILRGIDLMVTAGEVHARAVFNGKIPSTWENSPPSPACASFPFESSVPPFRGTRCVPRLRGGRRPLRWNRRLGHGQEPASVEHLLEVSWTQHL